MASYAAEVMEEDGTVPVGGHIRRPCSMDDDYESTRRKNDREGIRRGRRLRRITPASSIPYLPHPPQLCRRPSPQSSSACSPWVSTRHSTTSAASSTPIGSPSSKRKRRHDTRDERACRTFARSRRRRTCRCPPEPSRGNEEEEASSFLPNLSMIVRSVRCTTPQVDAFVPGEGSYWQRALAISGSRGSNGRVRSSRVTKPCSSLCSSPPPSSSALFPEEEEDTILSPE